MTAVRSGSGSSKSWSSCGSGPVRWALAQVLAGVRYYDMAGGLLAGIDSQIALPCGTNNQFGTAPQLCHYDAGGVQQRFTCAPGGGGVLPAGGSSLSCSQELPCYGGG